MYAMKSIILSDSSLNRSPPLRSVFQSCQGGQTLLFAQSSAHHHLLLPFLVLRICNVAKYIPLKIANLNILLIFQAQSH
jgi:hypothetical protein